MRIEKEQLHDLNKKVRDSHQASFGFLSDALRQQGLDVDTIVQRLADFQVAIPSWALGAGGTRFGRFSFAGEPSSLEQKIDDVGLIHALTQTAGGISLHIPWDVPEDDAAIQEHAASHDIIFDAVNSNTFQDQKGSEHSYKYGSLSSTSQEARAQAVQHNKEVIEIGNRLGSKSLTVWLADGSSFPGQKQLSKGPTAYPRESKRNLPSPTQRLAAIH